MIWGKFSFSVKNILFFNVLFGGFINFGGLSVISVNVFNFLSFINFCLNGGVIYNL